MAHPQNPATPNTSDTPLWDPAFLLDLVTMAATSALAALRRGDQAAAAEFASYAGEFVIDAQRGLAVVR